MPEIVEPKGAYVANMRALWEHMPRLGQQVDLVDETELAATEGTRSGKLTCKLMGAQGEAVYLHSRYDPEREARRWAEGVVQLGRGQEDKESGPATMCYIVDGFGLGYHVKALFEKLTGEAFVVVSEPNIAMIRTALNHFDYSEMLASRRLIVLTRADRDEIFKKLHNYGTTMMMGTVFTPPLPQINHDFHAAVHKLICEYTAFQRTMLVTMLGNAVLTCKNILYNLPTYVATPSIDVLQGRFSGCPAVVVSAGPSLGRNIRVLKEIRDKVVVAAVQTTLKPLLAEGIVPDFVTSLDYHEVGRQFFEGLDDLSEIHLVAEPKAHWKVIDYYRRRGPISLLGSDLVRMALRGSYDDHDNLPAGTTVAHLAFYLSQYLGADPIIFIGQDLAFTDNVYYSPGMAIHKTWKPELNRFCTVEMKEWERIVRNRGTLRQVEDIHGQTIYSDEQMFTYLQQFEKDFAQCPAEVIDATEGGALKQFCTTMSLKEAAEKYCNETIDREKFAYRKEIKFKRSRLKKAGEMIQQRIKDVREFEKISTETLAILREMLGLVDDQPELNKRMVRLDELRTMAKQRMEIIHLVSHVAQGAELSRYWQDRAIEVENLEGKELQRQQLRRDVGYIAEINKACGRMIELLEECGERLKEVINEEL